MRKPRMARTMLLAAGAVVTLCAALVYGAYQRDSERAWQRIATGSQIVQTSCGPIEYATAGEGPPVLVVHGAGGGFDQGMSVGAAFVERGLRVIAMSRFGYLRTPLPADASAAAQADAHACLLEALKLERVGVVGGSAGAPSALQFALRHPQRTAALALVVPVAYLPRPGDEPPVRPSRALLLLFDTALRWDFLYWTAIRLAPGTVMRAVMATPPEQVAAAGASEQARLYGALEQGLPVSVRRAGLLNDGAVLTTLPRYPLERITAPTLIISTANDLFGSYAIGQYTASQIRGARFVGFPDGGHLWVGHHEALVTEITALITAAAQRRTR